VEETKGNIVTKVKSWIRIRIRSFKNQWILRREDFINRMLIRSAIKNIPDPANDSGSNSSVCGIEKNQVFSCAGRQILSNVINRADPDS
jgi:hypothetical protein